MAPLPRCSALRGFAFACVLSVALGVPSASLAQEPVERIDVRVVSDEAEAALAILEKRAAGEIVDEADWVALYATEGFRRLEERARAFDGEVDREAFRAWLVSDSVVSKAAAYREAIEWWKALDPEAPAGVAFAYLPEDAVLRAKLYPSIKPQTNSFVFELDTDPAIFFHVDPDEDRAKIANTLAHELHHVGTAGIPDCEPSGVDALAEGARTAIDWLGGFHEGLAVLAAAGGPDVHPHAGREADGYVVWERDVARVNADIVEMDAFFLDVAEGRLTGDAIRERGFSFIVRDGVPQGSFYTVGWKMAAVVEKAEGRETVIASVCDPRVLLTAWNRVARAHPRPDGEGLPTWSPELMQALGAE